MVISEKNVRRVIHRWCKETNLKLERMNVDEAIFQYKVNHPPDSNLWSIIMNPKDRKDMLLLVTSFRIDEYMTDQFRSLIPQDRWGIIHDLRMKLLPLQAEFIINHPNLIIEEIQFRYMIYFDGLSKDHFMRGLRAIFIGRLYAQWFFEAINPVHIEQVTNQATSDV